MRDKNYKNISWTSSGQSAGDEKCRVVYEFLSSDNADSAAELYTEVFLNDEPMTRQHGIDPEKFLPCACEYLHFCAAQGMSVIAIDSLTQRIVGFGLTSDLTTDWDSVGPGMVTLLSFFRESVAILEEVEHRCPDLHDIRPGAVLHIFQGGVRREYRGRGVLTNIISRILIEAKNRGFQKIIGECTGPVSRHVLEKAGFREAASVVYDEFEVDGKAYFAGIPGRMSLMIRDV